MANRSMSLCSPASPRATEPNNTTRATPASARAAAARSAAARSGAAPVVVNTIDVPPFGHSTADYDTYCTPVMRVGLSEDWPDGFLDISAKSAQDLVRHGLRKWKLRNPRPGDVNQVSFRGRPGSRRSAENGDNDPGQRRSPLQ